MSPNLAPIIVFAYRRPKHLRRLLDSLATNHEARDSKIFLFSDGPRGASDSPDVAEVRNVFEEARGFREIHRHYSEKNQGLAKSVIGGVSEVLKSHDRAIILEDDLVVSPSFLRFMNEALSRYQDAPKVGSICGYFYPIPGNLPDTFFLREADCWGWATWRRSWELFEPDGKKLLERIQSQGLSHSFDVDGSYPYTQMLGDQISGKNDSWAIRWQASLFLAEKLTLFPGKSLVQNTGFDGSGEHCGSTRHFEVDLRPTPVSIANMNLKPDEAVEQLLAEYFRKIQLPPKSTFASRIKERAQGLLKAGLRSFQQSR